MGETVRLSGGETIHVSEEFYEWLLGRQREDETLEETVRRITRGPHPDEVAGLFSPEEAEEMKEAVKKLRRGDRERKRRAREAFVNEES